MVISFDAKNSSADQAAFVKLTKEEVKKQARHSHAPGVKRILLYQQCQIVLDIRC